MTVTVPTHDDLPLSVGDCEELLQPGVRVAVTGGRGFLGARLLASLARFKVSNIALEGDIREPKSFDQSFSVLLHCASPMPHHFDGDVDAALGASLSGIGNALDACQRNSARLIFASSSAVYRIDDNDTPVTEDALLGGPSPYGNAKRACEEACAEAQAVGRVACGVLRIFNSYGAGQSALNVLGYAAEQIRNQQPLEIELPEARRDFVHVADVAQAFLLAAAYEVSGPLNIGTGQSRSVREAVLDMAARAADPVDLRFSENPARPAMIADCSAARHRLGWRSRVPWPAGVEELLGQRPPLI